MGVVKAPVCNRWRGGTRAQATPAARGGLFQTLKRGASAGAMGADRQAHAGRSPGLPSFGPAQPARSYCAFMFTGMKSSLPWKYTTTMQSPPSSHLSSWTCLAGCDHIDPGPPVSGAAPLNVCVNLPWTTTPSYAAVCQCQPESIPAGNFCRISEAPSFGFPHTANICSPGCFGSTGFHGMASLVVKVPWVAPAFAPAAGVAPVPRASCANAVRDISAAPSASFANCFLDIFECLLSRCTGIAFIELLIAVPLRNPALRLSAGADALAHRGAFPSGARRGAENPQHEFLVVRVPKIAQVPTVREYRHLIPQSPPQVKDRLPGRQGIICVVRDVHTRVTAQPIQDGRQRFAPGKLFHGSALESLLLPQWERHPLGVVHEGNAVRSVDASSGLSHTGRMMARIVNDLGNVNELGERELQGLGE